MAVILHKRLPTHHNTFVLLSLCILATNVSAILRLLHEMPRFLLMLEWTELLGIIAYFGLFALIDGILFWLPLLATSIILPHQWLRANLVVQGFVMIALLSVWLLLKLRWVIRLAGWEFVGATLIVFVGAFVVSRLVVLLDGGRVIEAGIGRLSLLAYLYITIDIVCVLVIVVRQIGASL